MIQGNRDLEINGKDLALLHMNGSSLHRSYQRHVPLGNSLSPFFKAPSSQYT